MIGRNDTCWCGSGKKWKKCHYPQENKILVDDDLKRNYRLKHNIMIKDDKQIEGIKRACQLTADILQETCRFAKIGMTTLEINDFCHKLHLDAGALPAPLGYGSPPFPKSICTSLNDVICHGIPDDTIIKEGDILNIDVSCILNGYYGDCSRMVVFGSIDDESQNVVDTAYDCLMKSIEILKPGVLVSEIGSVIEDYANSRHCSVVNQFVGHGVGLQFHEGPQVPHYRNSVHIPLVAGMTFTIEPMINAGRREAKIDLTNEWTARTVDGKPSAQWEHTLLITDTGYEILTPWVR